MSVPRPSASIRILVVTAVEAERDAVLAGLAQRPAVGDVQGLRVHRALTAAGLLDVVCGGVGPVAAAVSAGCLLGQGYDLAVSAGIGGGFAAAPVGTVVVADAVVHADLGAETHQGFVSMAELGWGAVRYPVPAGLAAEFSRRTGAVTGAVLSVSTVTGSQRRADQLLARHPDAVAEAMEGVGVCLAADRAGVPFAELRAIANPVGPRDRESWRVSDALAALGAAFDRLLAEPLAIRTLANKADGVEGVEGVEGVNGDDVNADGVNADGANADGADGPAPEAVR